MSKIAFLFPGQGAQEVGMGRELYVSNPQAKSLFDRASQSLGYDLKQVCFEGPKEKLDSTVYSQPALFVSSLAALELLKSQKPEAVANCAGAAGLSLGEYSALVFAGVIPFESGLKLVQQRGEAMQAAADAVPSGMVSVLGLDREKLQSVCEQARQPNEVLQMANLLCPGNIAVSGHRAACERLTPIAEQAGAIKSIPLAVAGAFHTPLMQSALERLRVALEATPFAAPKVPVYSNVDAQTHCDPNEIKELLLKQVCSPVLWHDSLDRMLADGFDEFYEVGPGRVLRGLLKRISRKTPCYGTLDA